MARQTKIERLGLSKLVDSLINDGLSRHQIHDYLIVNKYDLKYRDVDYYVKKVSNTINQEIDESEFINTFSVINTVQLLGELEIPDLIDTQEKAVSALQKAHLQVTFDIWAILTTAIKEIKNGDVKSFPTEVFRAYATAIKLSTEILGVEQLINENSALKTIENLGYTVEEK